MGIKYYVNENFFRKWTPKMAYVLGYLFADGNVVDAPYMRGKYISVTSVEKQIIVKIKKWLNSRHTIVPLKPSWPNGKTRYLLRIGSHKIYSDLIGLGLFPNKSLTVKFPAMPTKYLGDFTRGYFDGDGCVYLQTSRGRKQSSIVRKLSVIFTSGSKAFLQQLADALRQNIELKQNKVYTSHRSFQLRYATADSVKLFKFLYKDSNRDIYFKRKFKIFLDYFVRRPIKVDESIRKILKHSNFGHVVK